MWRAPSGSPGGRSVADIINEEVATSTTSPSWQIDDPMAWLQARLDIVASAFCQGSPARLGEVYSSGSDALPAFEEAVAASSGCPTPVVESVDTSRLGSGNETNPSCYAIVTTWSSSTQLWSVHLEYEDGPKIDNDPSESPDCTHDLDTAFSDLCAGHELPEL